MKYLFTVLLTAMSLFSFAQKSSMHSMKDFTPEQIAELQTKKMTLALDLNATQQKKVYDLNKKMAAEGKAKMMKMRNLKQQGTPLTAEQRFEMQKNMLDMQIKRQNEMKAILTKEQYAQWKAMQSEKHSKMHTKMNCNKKKGAKKMKQQ